MRIGPPLSRLFSREEVIALVEKAILLFKKEGLPGERFGSTVERLGLPVVKNPCPANGHTKREEMKGVITSLEREFPQVKERIFGAMQRYPICGWEVE